MSVAVIDRPNRRRLITIGSDECGWRVGKPFERTGLPDWKLSLSYYPPLVTASERDVLSGIRCPRVVFAGADDVVESDGLVAEHRRELEDMGWTVGLVPGERHDPFLRIDVVPTSLASSSARY